MANLNKVLLIGRLGRDPETRMFANGGKVASFSLCVNNRKKNSQTGQWEDDPCWLDCSAFNRGDNGKTADLVEQYLRKGSQAFIEGRLQMDQWTDQQGQKRQKLKIVVDNVQFLDPKNGNGQERSAPSQGYRSSMDNDDLPPPPMGRDEPIPF